MVQLERPTINFDAGQYVSVGFPEKIDMREYSVYSGPDDDVLEVLVRRVDGGLVSPQLVDLEPGDRVRVEGPFGFFTIPEENRSERFLWVSTGTGIAPFRSFVRAYPDLDYTLLHGVRRMVELYDWSEYEPDRKVACVSREEGGDFRGRVTDYLRGHPPSPETQCYLCGNAAMIYEVYDILQNQGVDTDRIHAEVYF
ncbi:MAG: oxidoreductase [Spirochaetes bacterium]|nr:oxidoreductase [Spirochaetota bacterium]